MADTHLTAVNLTSNTEDTPAHRPGGELRRLPAVAGDRAVKASSRILDTLPFLGVESSLERENIIHLHYTGTVHLDRSRTVI